MISSGWFHFVFSENLKGQHIFYSLPLCSAQLFVWVLLACIIVLPAHICPEGGHSGLPLKFTTKKLTALGDYHKDSLCFQVRVEKKK